MTYKYEADLLSQKRTQNNRYHSQHLHDTYLEINTGVTNSTDK